MARALHGVHVAIAGDPSDARNVLAEILRHHGALVTVHDSARSVMRVMAALEVNVVVVDLDDVTAPHLNMIRAFRGAPAANGGRVPIVVLVSSPGDMDPRLAAVDVAAVVRKPVQVTALVRIIATAASVDQEGTT